MIQKTILPILFCCFLAMPVCLTGQTAEEAASYLGLISEQYQHIQKETWNYTSTIAHSQSAKKVEKNRINLLKTIKGSIQVVKALPAFDNDFSLRDSVISYLSLNYDVLNNDYSKIIDMEEIAEQSYDLMEAYILAQEKANEKLEASALQMDNQYEAFAHTYNIQLVESNDKLSQKLKSSSEALKYYDQVYLIFFKAYKQEFYLIDALTKNDINSTEQNRNALASIVSEGLEGLKGIGHFNGDNALNTSCKRMLLFYQDEAETKMPVLTDFLQTANEYKKMVSLYQSKDKMLLTNEEINKYNKAVDGYNKGIKTFNTINSSLNTKRNAGLNDWNNSVTSFMNRHVPKK